jgi:hypothetical protein
MQLGHQPELDFDPWANIPEGPFQFISLEVPGLCILNLKINSVTENFKNIATLHQIYTSLFITLNSVVQNSFVQGIVSRDQH